MHGTKTNRRSLDGSIFHIRRGLQPTTLRLELTCWLLQRKGKAILPRQLERLTAVNPSASPFPGRIFTSCPACWYLFRRTTTSHPHPIASYFIISYQSLPLGRKIKPFVHDGFYFISWYTWEMLKQNELVLSSIFFQKNKFPSLMLAA